MYFFARVEVNTRLAPMGQEKTAECQPLRPLGSAAELSQLTPGFSQRYNDSWRILPNLGTQTKVSSMARGWGYGLLVLLACCGCAGSGPADPRQNPTTQKDEEVVPLVLVVLNDPRLADAIRREWQARSKAQLEVKSVVTPGKMPPTAPQGDLVVFAVDRLGELAEQKWIVPLPEATQRGLESEREDLSAFAMRQECSWGNTLWGMPLGSTSYTLYARADLLRDQGLSLPTTWEEYGAVVRRLRASAWGKEAGHVAAAEPTSSAYGGKFLLARAASYLRHRGNYSTYFDFQSMEPLITSPPMVKALEELVAASDAENFNEAQQTPGACLDRFWRGEAALAIVFPGHPEKKEEAKISPEQVAISELPGSLQVFNHSDQEWEKRGAEEQQRVPLFAAAGRMGSLLAASPNKVAAARALQLITSAEWSLDLSPESAATGPFRRSHLKEMNRWVEPQADVRLRRDLADLIAARFDVRLSLSPPRLPGGSLYLESLDRAVLACLTKSLKPEEALAKAAEEWRKITADLGLAAQKGAYRRSLGLQE